MALVLKIILVTAYELGDSDQMGKRIMIEWY